MSDGEGSLIWTLHDSSSEKTILSEFFIGAGSMWGTLGWYLGRIPHTDKREGLDHLMMVCATCEGQGVYFDSEVDDEEECTSCLENPVYVELVHKVGPEGILTFTGSDFWRG